MHTQGSAYKCFKIILGRIHEHQLVRRNIKEKDNHVLRGREIVLDIIKNMLEPLQKIVVIVKNGSDPRLHVNEGFPRINKIKTNSLLKFQVHLCTENKSRF